MKTIFPLLFLFQATPMDTIEGPPYLVQTELTREDARLYCENKTAFLASIRSADDANRFLSCDTCWIGLKAAQINPFVWKWPEGDTATYVNWDSNEPDVGSDQNCVTLRSTGKWHNDDCGHQYKFFSQERRLVLVKENKTWEEALEHCRVLGTEPFSVVTQYSPPNQLHPNSYGPSYSDYPDHQPIYDLPSVLSQDQTFVQDFIQDALTDENLPGCPVQVRYCGTLPKNGPRLWGIQDCRERRNFLCYRNA